MIPPRLNFAVVGDSSAGLSLARGLSEAGHRCTHDVAWCDLGVYNAVLLAVDEATLPEILGRLEGTMTGKHIVIHSALGAGSAELFELGSVAIAMHLIAFDTFVVSTGDEISQTVAELLVSEMKAIAYFVPDAERPALQRAAVKMEEAMLLEQKAYDLVSSESAQLALAAKRY